MTKQCLDVHQMQHLQELGLELKETLLYWARCVDNNPRASTHYGKWVLIKGNIAQTVGLMHWEFIPAYTLQDVLDALPTSIRHNDCTYYLGMAKRGIAYELYSEHGMVQAIQFGRRTLIDAAYEMLCWAIENKFVETNKNE